MAIFGVRNIFQIAKNEVEKEINNYIQYLNNKKLEMFSEIASIETEHNNACKQKQNDVLKLNTLKAQTEELGQNNLVEIQRKLLQEIQTGIDKLSLESNFPPNFELQIEWGEFHEQFRRIINIPRIVRVNNGDGGGSEYLGFQGTVIQDIPRPQLTRPQISYFSTSILPPQGKPIPNIRPMPTIPPQGKSIPNIRPMFTIPRQDKPISAPCEVAKVDVDSDGNEYLSDGDEYLDFQETDSQDSTLHSPLSTLLRSIPPSPPPLSRTQFAPTLTPVTRRPYNQRVIIPPNKYSPRNSLRIPQNPPSDSSVNSLRSSISMRNEPK